MAAEVFTLPMALLARGCSLSLQVLTMLVSLPPCPHPLQVIEIATITEHLLEECEHKASYAACPRCQMVRAGSAVCASGSARRVHAQAPPCSLPSPSSPSSSSAGHPH